LLTATVTVECTKEGVKFAASGDIGSGAVTLRSHTDVEKPENNVDIDLSEPVALTFSLKYLVGFCKATGLSSSVKMCLSNEVPLLVEYELSNGSYLRFYLAPKVCNKPNPTMFKKFRLIMASLLRSVTKSDGKSA
jgi:proliferating cell nuclear antigen